MVAILGSGFKSCLNQLFTFMLDLKFDVADCKIQIAGFNFNCQRSINWQLGVLLDRIAKNNLGSKIGNDSDWINVGLNIAVAIDTDKADSIVRCHWFFARIIQRHLESSRRGIAFGFHFDWNSGGTIAFLVTQLRQWLVGYGHFVEQFDVGNFDRQVCRRVNGDLSAFDGFNVALTHQRAHTQFRVAWRSKHHRLNRNGWVGLNDQLVVR